MGCLDPECCSGKSAGQEIKSEQEYEVRAAEGGHMEIIGLNGTLAERHSD